MFPATICNTELYCILNYKILSRTNGEEQLNLVLHHFCLDCPAISFETTPTSVLQFSGCNYFFL